MAEEPQFATRQEIEDMERRLLSLMQRVIGAHELRLKSVEATSSIDAQRLTLIERDLLKLLLERRA